MIQWIVFATEIATETGAPEGGLFDLNATLPLMAIQFLFLAFILNALFFKPLGQVIDERDAYIRGNRQEARERSAKAGEMAQQLEQELAKARRDAQEAIARSRAEAQQQAAQQVAEVQREIQAQREQSQQELEQQKQLAFQSLGQDVDALSQSIIAKLLGPQWSR